MTSPSPHSRSDALLSIVTFPLRQRQPALLGHRLGRAHLSGFDVVAARQSFQKAREVAADTLAPEPQDDGYVDQHVNSTVVNAVMAMGYSPVKVIANE